MGRKINMVRKDGTVVAVPAEKVKDYLFLGYREEGGGESLDRLQVQAEKEHYDTLGNEVIAFAEGAADMATLGLAGVLMDDEATRKRAAYNPNARLAGEIVGAVAPAVGSGGILGEVTLAGRVARGAEGFAGRVAGSGLKGKVLAGAIEGGVTGAGAELSHATLSGDPLTVEQVLSGIGVGAMFGVGGGALAQGVEGAGTWARGRQAARKGSTLEEDFLANFAAKGEDITQSPIITPPPKVNPELGPAAFTEAVTPDEVRVSAARAVLAPERYRGFKAAVGDVRARAHDALKQVEAASHSLKQVPLVQQADALKKQGDDIYAAAFAKPGKGPDMVNQARVMSALRSRGQALTKAVKSGETSKVQKALDAYKETLETAATLTGKAITAPEALSKAAKQVEEVVGLTKAVDTAYGLLGDDAADLFALGNNRAEDLFAAVDGVMSSNLPEAKLAQGALTDAIKELGAAVGIVADNPSATLRQVWAAGRRATKDSVDYWHATSRAARKADGGAVDSGLGDIDPNQPNVTKATPKMAKKGPMERAGSRMVDSLERAAGYAAIGSLFHGSGLGVASSLVSALFAAKAGAASAIERAVVRLGPKATRAVAKVAPRVEPLYRSFTGIQDPEGDLKDAFAARSKELRNAAVIGRDQAFITAQKLSAAGHPEFANQAYNSAVHAIDALINRLPKDPPGTRWGFEYIWETPPEQLAVFSQEWQAGTDPAAFIGFALENPTDVFPSAVDTLADSWPAIYEDFRSRVLERLMETGTSEYDTDELAGLSVILRAPLLPTMTPDFIGDQAAMWAQPPPEPSKTTARGQAGRPPGNDATKSQMNQLR